MDVSRYICAAISFAYKDRQTHGRQTDTGTDRRLTAPPCDPARISGHGKYTLMFQDIELFENSAGVWNKIH